MNRLDDALDVLIYGGAVLCMSSCVVFGLWFAPGWANGWPFHRNIVWPIGMSCAVFVALFITATCFGAMVSIPRSHPDWPFGEPSWTWIKGSLFVSGVTALLTFVGLRSQAVAVWP